MNGLQLVCDVLLENPSWTIAHLVAYFNQKEHLSHPKLSDVIDEPDFSTFMTPIQVCLSIYRNLLIRIYNNQYTNDSHNFPSLFFF